VLDGVTPSGALALYAIAPTLFDAGGDVDTGAMRAAVSWMVEQGIDDILVTGSYGEFQSLTDDERVAVVGAVRQLPGVRTVMACAATSSTEGTVALGRRLTEAGADMVMVAAPFCAEVSSEELHRHFQVLASKLDGPLVVYNNPVFGMDLSVEDLARIVRLPGFCAVKQGTSSFKSFAQSIPALHDASAGRARVLAASDLTAAIALFAGADGLTSTNSWAFPRAVRAIVECAAAGDWGGSRRLAAAVEPYFALARTFGQPRTVKAAMSLRGLPGQGRVRLPYRPLEEDEVAEVDRAIEKCDAELAMLGVGRKEREE